ncbi:AraC family transcriptional regulator [Flavobacterium psychroterrae]|uniref:AraC family transcriptional regulator n=1 Tax=Flavobacterium psychroterrae TaxID=2133767 RepID=A0ABS5PIY6_9FLAO|nr:helix-turn-helix domain-containing protein [Flavobacterium psychroterrae]MBS7233785.1 AraC family transcriptional regulator [Flavobacterium psychroterrae]
MVREILKIKSIDHLHQLMGLAKPLHPYISLINASKFEIGKQWLNVKMTSELYCISLKDAACGMHYGRNIYDFSEGVLMFTGPHQVYSLQKEQKKDEVQGWMLFFHPDLLRNTPLEKTIDSFSFFSYDLHEALHLSEKEEQTITQCVNMIQEEIGENIDYHTQKLIVNCIEMLLNFCSRYYDRQFGSRNKQNSDILSRIEQLLKTYYQSGLLTQHGIPSVGYLAEKMNMSAHYLSDLLKKETGRSALEHINDFIIDKAKKILLASPDNISEIAYSLGFNYPHYFSRLFKTKTGMSPIQYRTMN